MGCCVSRLAAKFAFFPPNPATYQVKKEEDGSMVVTGIPPDSSMDVLMIDTKRGNKIVGFYLRNPYARLTVLYSHGNAADLGQLYDLFVQLKVNLRVNVMGIVLRVFLFCEIQPSESNTYADIEAVYQRLETEYGISQEDLILYGQSVGSGPTLHLAAKLPRLRGVVLHSGILSGLRVLCHVKTTLCFDIYKNINKIQKVKCPVLVIHGTEDDVVNWFHGNALWKLAKEPYEPLWIKGGGHCNLEIVPTACVVQDPVAARALRDPVAAPALQYPVAAHAPVASPALQDPVAAHCPVAALALQDPVAAHCPVAALALQDRVAACALQDPVAACALQDQVAACALPNQVAACALPNQVAACALRDPVAACALQDPVAACACACAPLQDSVVACGLQDPVAACAVQEPVVAYLSSDACHVVGSREGGRYGDGVCTGFFQSY
ncbi:protein ABHD17B isoform X1 [Cinnamomum micranthum f. kanehirae]|uniref:Protein ABHD17B isoform X1 n=1 Tax=Cinnamomum micranthum f. kanehirae TaxID=337451 RepID=A0A3S3MW26_9MAGN|nr:protein ABHD17B isoform X1 [Cinnamomum micranthum f. kanehirae]